MNEKIELTINETLKRIKKYKENYLYRFLYSIKVQLNRIGLAFESNNTLQLFGKWKLLRFNVSLTF